MPENGATGRLGRNLLSQRRRERRRLYCFIAGSASATNNRCSQQKPLLQIKLNSIEQVLTLRVLRLCEKTKC
jgi:hypothetical protein